MTRYEFPSRMDLRHLRYFAVVADEGNFHRASERLNIAQSALSRRIMELEEAMALSLFERSAKGVALTDAGKVFQEHAQRIVGEADRAKTHLKRLASGKAGLLRFGLNRVAPQLPIVSETFRAFRAAYPGVELKLLPMGSEQQVDALLAGDIDFGILSNRPERPKDFDYRTLLKDRFILVLPADHLLARPGTKIWLHDLADEDFVLFGRTLGPSAHDRLLASFAAQGIAPKIVQESRSEDAQLGLVAAGMGLTFTFSSITSRYHRDDLAFRPVEDLDVPIDIDLAWRQSDRSPLRKYFLDKLDAVAAAFG
jgi:DNA-binding transcriptional LysR family regulator